MQLRPLLWSTSITLAIICMLIGALNPILQTDAPFFIGQATADGISVTDRISNFYGVLLIGISILALLSIGFSKYYERIISKFFFLSWIENLLLLGSLLGIASLLAIPVKESMIAVFSCAFLLILAGKIKGIHRLKETPELALVFLLAVLVNHLLFHGIGIGLICTLLVFGLWFSKKMAAKYLHLLLSLLVSTPLIAFLSIETTLSLHHFGVKLSSYLICSLFYILIFCVYFLWKDKKSEVLLFKRWIPLSLVGITLCQVYMPIIMQPTELFETANVFNPLMQYYNFGEIPFVDNLSSHLFYDYSLEFIYSFLHGFDGSVAPSIYGNLHQVFTLLIAYYFLKALVGNRMEFIAWMLFLPYFYFVLPPYYAYVLLPIIPLIHFFQNQKLKHLIYFSIALAFLTVWRLDLSVSLVSSSAICVLLWWINQKEWRPVLLKFAGFGLLLFSALGLVLYLMIGSHLQEALHYFGANQAHGLSNVTGIYSTHFYIDYYILPAAIALIVVKILFEIKQSKTPTLHWTLILLAGFYFFNLQRGLVRHSFIENNEVQISSFGWFILLGYGWSLLKTKVSFFPYILFASSVLAILFTIKPLNESTTRFDTPVQLSLKNLPDLQQKHINRVIPSDDFVRSNRTIIRFLKRHLSGNETFLDFSNNPMLYFYSKKNVPSYFNQFLQNVVDDYLQDQALVQIKQAKLPIVIFRKDPESGLDVLDGIPNKIRYYKINSYILKNYSPYRVVGGFVVWLKNDHPKFEQMKAHYSNPQENWGLGLIPFYWNLSAETKTVNQKVSNGIDSISQVLEFSGKIEIDDFLLLAIESNSEQNCTLSKSYFQCVFKLKKGLHEYLVPIGHSEQVILDKTSFLRFNSDSIVKLNQMKLVHLRN